MKALLLTVLSILAALVQCSVGCLHFEAIPSIIHFGKTKDVTINCTFRYTESSAIINVTEISVARSENRVLNEMVTMKRRQNVINKNFSSDLTADGFFDVNDMSALTVRMKGLVVGDAGTYVCLVKGLDATGQIHEAVDSVSVTFNVSEEICPSVKKKETFPFFFPSLMYKGSNYYLSKYGAANSSMAEDFCSDLGGYLMEADDYDELKMAYQLSQQYNIKTTLIAGTDAEQEGVWVFPRTGKPVKILNWALDEPNNLGGIEDCRIINFARRIDKINDAPCDGFFSFICEKNEAPESEALGSEALESKAPKSKASEHEVLEYEAPEYEDPFFF